MEKSKKEILLKNRVGLVENINIEDGLLTELLSRKALTQRTIKNIQAKKTTYDQTEELLDKIAVKSNGFEVLSEALIANDQEDIVNLYLKPPEKETETSKNEVKTESDVSQRSQTVQEPTRPHSSPPRIPVPRTQVSHLTTKEVQLIQQGECSTSKVSAIAYGQENSQGVQCSEVQLRHHPPSDSVFHPIQRPSVQPIPPSSSDNNSSIIWVSGNPNQPYNFSDAVFFDRVSKNNTNFKENEQRYNKKHYINDPYYEPLLESSPRTVASQMPLNNNIHPMPKAVVYVPSHKPAPLQREDTLDAMTKPLGSHEENCESPAKRQRKEDRIEINGFESNLQSDGTMVNQTLPRSVRLRGELDDPEIDLTDGPVIVRVDHTTRQFYLANVKNSYAMRRLPRGKALIINVNEVEGKPPRRGTDIDRDNLHNLLVQLHFDVKVYNDCDGLSAKEMAQKLEVFAADPAHFHGDAVFLCLLSHGEEGYIFGTDGRKLQLDSVFKLFDNSNCPSLVAKPKIFVIQACRGGALDSGVPLNDEHDGSAPGSKQLPTQSDMIICFPTQTGYYAWRNRERGSWYIEALVQIFMKYAKSEDICTMLHRVNLLVSRKVSRCPQLEMDSMSQMSEYKSTLRMPHLYFYPGIGCVEK